jgi:hypothetical protein
MISLGQKYCTACGAGIPEGKKFCEQCGSPVVPDPAGPALQSLVPAGPPSGTPPYVSPPEGGNRRNYLIAVTVVILLVIAGAGFFILPLLQGTQIPQGGMTGPVTTQTAIPVTASLPTVPATTTAPAQKPDPFPAALKLKDKIPFGTGSVASEATVYRYWINDTYEWHNDKDNHYYVEKAGAGNKFLFVFVHLQNNGDTRVWFPPAGNIVVFYNGARYTEDRDHYKPDKVADEEATPVEVKEVQYFQKLNGDEYAEDFGFSHGTELAYLYPGASNAVDGYIIYEVPGSLVPEETYVAIPFNGQDQGVWKLG